MLLWIGFAALTAGVILYLARPLVRVSDTSSPVQPADVAVYRDQLRAIEAERDQGLLDSSEAEAARTELARRLLRAADQADASGANAEGAAGHPVTQGNDVRSKTTHVRPLVIAASVLIPVLSIGIYLFVGSPTVPGLPFADRVAQGKQERSVTDLIGLVETRLREHPDDGQGWEVLAPVYMKQERFDDAARAYANSIRINGENLQRVAGFAEAMVLANNGLVVPDARKAYQRLLAIAPDRPEPHFWLALAKEQDGDVPGAIADLDAMLKRGPDDAPWRPMLEAKLSELRSSLAGGGTPDPSAQKSPDGSAVSKSETAETAKVPARDRDSATQPRSGPGTAEMAAVEQMTPQERSAFISKMVEGLAVRLAENGKDLDGWKRLARAYKVMGREGDAVKALADARRAFEGDKAALDALEVFAKDLGIGS